MAILQNAHPRNVPGKLFVDTSCIDCGTCYLLASEIFTELADEKSVVKKQPEGLEEWSQAKAAIVSCPTNSIGVHEAPHEFKDAPIILPLKIDRNVYYCGHTSRSSFGATTYFIQREEGNVLIDSPRFNSILIKEIEKMGGVKYMFLSHQDDVADHELFHKHFSCQRIIHEKDVHLETKNAEVIIQGEQPFSLKKDLLVIPTPGHTKGSMSLLYGHDYLFTGDHLFVSDQTNELRASKNVCWYSWPVQLDSIRKLKNYKFHWILPGHGRWTFKNEQEIQEELNKILNG